MSWSIGEVARRTGLTPDALRYYERQELLPPAPRDAGGRRRYDESVLDVLTVITVLRGAGFSIRQVRDVIGVKVPGQTARRRVEAMREVIACLDGDIADRRAALDRAQEVLTQMRAELDGGEPWPDEPLD